MRTNMLTTADKKLPRNIRRVLAGLAKPRTALESAVLVERLVAAEKVRLDAAKARAAAKAVA